MALTTPRTWVVGEVVTAAIMNIEVRDQFTALIAGQPRIIRKTATTDRASTTVLTDDPELKATLQPNAVYNVLFMIFALSASATPDLLTNWTVPSGAFGLKACTGPTDNSATFSSRTDTNARMSGHGLTTQIGYQVSTAAISIREEGVVTTGAAGGTLALQWAQFVSTATPTSIVSSSYLSVQRVD
ncbi:MAG: hypothetical protein M3467_04070 [Actinomycetota bacterium]|nr:hypothetical protein [Actinomycetota bacterium]